MEALWTILAVVVGYGIPIYLGVQAWRNGHRDWVWSIILATFGILGIMGIWLSSMDIQEGDYKVVVGVIVAFACLLAFYIIAWVKTKMPLATPVECLKCGKPSKARQRLFQDQVTGKKVQSPLIGTISLVCGLACIILFFMGGGIATLVLGIPLAGIGINAIRRSTTQKMEFKCTICGNIFIQ